MTDLVLVRHGQTVWHAENRYAGVSDIGLTETGVRQAERLAAWAKGAALDAVWCSTLSRARITATPSAEAAGVGLRVDARLRELDFGLGEGLTKAEMNLRFPAARAAFEADPSAHPLPGGERPGAAADRFVSCLRQIEGDRVLVVAHTTAIRLALCHLLGIPLADYRRRLPALDNAALTEIRLHPSHASLLRYNSPLP
ncbi:putative phosphoglycerate mutase [Actinocorallia herbida]|uniref:Putative phosphoglycerate mutase n=1 Tax=Actinocorallia herbida TaxID=58109 RepID=A0A3N1D562_9ACTN|nr:histidine phosphatase family protein [Actinocorallia herbida]ROO88619.1 putative phosphoglycerate mutase [Actinocorallia herbida]